MDKATSFKIQAGVTQLLKEMIINQQQEAYIKRHLKLNPSKFLT